MANNDGGKFVLGAGALVLFWSWWKNRHTTPLSSGGSGNTGGMAGASKPGCGCNTKPFQPANPSAPTQIKNRGPLPAIPSIVGGSSDLDPAPAPGGNATPASGGEKQWQGVTYRQNGVLTGQSAPNAPRIQTGPTVLTGNTRVRKVVAS